MEIRTENQRTRTLTVENGGLLAATQCELLIGLCVTCDCIRPQSLAEHMFSSCPTMMVSSREFGVGVSSVELH